MNTFFVTRNLHVEGENIYGACTTKDKTPKELFNCKYCYDCNQLSISKQVQFIAVKCLVEGFPSKLMIVSCLNI